MISSTYLLETKLQADQTNPMGFTIEDVFFTGVLRTLTNLGQPLTVRNICSHFNGGDKITRLFNEIYKSNKI